MNNIILTQKDADFILTYLRADLAKTNENFDLALKKEDEINRRIEKSGELKNSPFTRLIADCIKGISNEYGSLYKQKTDILVKCIELLTVGSEL